MALVILGVDLFDGFVYHGLSLVKSLVQLFEPLLVGLSGMLLASNQTIEAFLIVWDTNVALGVAFICLGEFDFLLLFREDRVPQDFGH